LLDDGVVGHPMPQAAQGRRNADAKPVLPVADGAGFLVNFLAGGFGRVGIVGRIVIAKHGDGPADVIGRDIKAARFGVDAGAGPLGAAVHVKVERRLAVGARHEPAGPHAFETAAGVFGRLLGAIGQVGFCKL
jgi:hypothetical protein